MPEMLVPHPFAEKYPPLPHNQFLSLCNDIVVKGLLEPIVLYQGKILDGWHRYQACIREKVEPKFVEFQPGEDPDYRDVEAWEFVRSKNWVRRHLTAEQRQQVAEELLNFNPMQSDRAIARQAGLSHHTVARLRNRPGTESNGQNAHYEDAVPAPFEEQVEKAAAGLAPEPPPRLEESGRKARGRKPGVKTAKTKPKPGREPFLRSARDESANTMADSFRRDVIDAVESLVQIVSGYDGLIQQKLSLVRRQELVAKFANALGVAPPANLHEAF